MLLQMHSQEGMRTWKHFSMPSIIQPNWIVEARVELKNDEEVWKLIQKLQ